VSATRDMKQHYAQQVTALMSESWRTDAACAGHVMDNPGTEREAKALCLSCPVKPDCHRAVLALTDRQDNGGVIAGLTEAERTHQRASRRGVAASKRRWEAM
jgi:hypothetical protein